MKKELQQRKNVMINQSRIAKLKKIGDGNLSVGIRAACDAFEVSGASESALCDILNEMLDLEPNWDSYGADRINQKAVEIAKQIAPVLPGFQVVPTPVGGVQFERSSDDVEIEISI